MNSPISLISLVPRNIDEIAAAAHAVQANVVSLRVAWCKRTGEQAELHDIKTLSPGPVTRSREMLIDWRIIRDYSTDEIALRLRQVWGEFCALCWFFPFVDPQKPIRFEPLSPQQAIRCLGEIQEKLAEIQYGLWRMRHEERVRNDPEARKDPAFQREHEIALARPLSVFGQAIHLCSDEDLFCCACEYAGMLAAMRWATDRRWAWEAPGIMDVMVPA